MKFIKPQITFDIWQLGELDIRIPKLMEKW